MKLFVEKSYEISIYGDIDIDIKNYVDWLRKEIPTRENLQDYIDRYNLVEADSSCYAEEYTNVFLDYLRVDDTEELFEEVKRLQRKEYGSSI